MFLFCGLRVGQMVDQEMEIGRGYTLVQLWLEGEKMRWIKGIVPDYLFIHERTQNYMCW